MQFKDDVLVCVCDPEIKDMLNTVIASPVEISASALSVQEHSLIVYELNDNSEMDFLEECLSSENYFMFVSPKEFDPILEKLSEKFFFTFCHCTDGATEMLMRINGLDRYRDIRIEVEKKSEELQDTIFELAIASTNVLEQNEFLEQMATKDGLTLLFNHSYFKDKLKDEFDRAKRYGTEFTIALLDLDFFKKVNDMYGHLKGDEVLKSFANILGDTVRNTDLAARYGGEEFAILMPETNVEQAVAGIERVRKAMNSKTFESQDRCFIVTFSAGVTDFKKEFNDIEEMIDASDKALYISKDTGRNKTTVFKG